MFVAAYSSVISCDFQGRAENRKDSIDNKQKQQQLLEEI